MERDYELVPGAFVTLLGQPDWGLGQIQSYIGHRITVNFEHRGKVVLDDTRAQLRLTDPPD